MRLSAVVLALATHAGAHAGVLDTLNSARSGECGARSASPLRTPSRLTQAARLMSRGESLRDALQGAGYRADEVTAIHLSGVDSTSEMRHEIASRFCKTLADARFTDAGVARRASEYWVILAAPFSPPATGSAGQVSEQVLALVNSARAQPRRCGTAWYDAAPPLRLDPLLREAASAHAREMAAHARLEHIGLDGSTPGQRVRRTGLAPLAEVGENIAGGAMTAQEAVSGWLKSPGHCANLMNPRYQLMGLSFAVNDRSELGIYWAQEFAALFARPAR
jgi:uncharacterized protein YkwD